MWAALAAGCISAIAFMAAGAGFAGSFVLACLAPLPLLLAGLGLGSFAAMAAGFAGFVLSWLLGGFPMSLWYAMMNALPAWVMSSQLLSKRVGANGDEQWASAGAAMAWLSVLAAIVLAAWSLMLVDGAGSAGQKVFNYLNEVFAGQAPNLPEAARLRLVKILTPLLPGSAVALWILIIAANAALAQKIMTNGKRNLRPSPRMAALVLPSWTSWPLVGAATLALLGAGDLEYISRNLSVVLAAPFFFLGLAVVHYAAERVTFPGTLLAYFYFVLIVSGWSPLVVIGIGMIEQWAGLRSRFAGPSNISGDD